VVSKPVANWKRFYARRIQRTLVPYVVWSLLYVLFRYFVMRAEGDLRPVELASPFLGMETLPKLLVPAGLIGLLIWGKAYYHIYFMVVLLQFSVLFPGLLHFVQRVRLPFVGIVGVGLAIQYVCFVLQNRVLHMRYPGSTILWYMAPVIVGIWIGVRWREWGDVWVRWRIAIGLLAAGGLGAYLPLALAHFRHDPIPSMPYNMGISAYCLGIALLLLALSQRIARMPRLARLIQPIGDRSIVFFLIHPMVLYMLGGPRITAAFAALPAPSIWLGLAMFCLTWMASQATRKLRLDGVLFAR